MEFFANLMHHSMFFGVVGYLLLGLIIVILFYRYEKTWEKKLLDACADAKNLDQIKRLQHIKDSSCHAEFQRRKKFDDEIQR